MMCAWKELLMLLPGRLRNEAGKFSASLQEIRLRLDQPGEFVTADGTWFLGSAITAEDIRFCVNAGSGYSPWASVSATHGYITAPGGHRIGLGGTPGPGGFRTVTSVNIRVAREIMGVSDGLSYSGNLLILGPPGSGKTTFLRDIVRRLSYSRTVCVVDERGEIFPEGISRGLRTDVLTGCTKEAGIGMALRTLGPQIIAVDEITEIGDCNALIRALWCGVDLIATAHAATGADLQRRMVYRPLVESGCFDTAVVLRRDKSWYTEEVRA